MRFGATLALHGVDVRSEAKKIHALIGANGAGKSTFLGIIAGRIAPTEGEVSIFGQPHSFGSPRLAHRLGVAAIYQELTIVPAMSTQANVFLGQAISRFGLVAKRQMREEYLRLCERLGVSIPPDVPAGRLAVADQQMLEIMRGVRSGARLLLFDEPTASLAPPECEALLRIIRDLKAHGVSMMFVSHKLEEVLDIADLVTVFRDGQVAATGPREQWTKHEMVRAMIGREIQTEPSSCGPRVQIQGQAPVLEAKGVSIPGILNGIDISVQPGEIVGLGGLVGSGRTSLLRALAGMEPHSTGKMLVDGQPIAWPKAPYHALRAGIALVPEDRKLQGLVLQMTGTSNITMTNYGLVSKFGILSTSEMAKRSGDVAARFGFDPKRLSVIVRNLSGGNQQKVLLSKWGYYPPRLLLVDEPTRGIDIGAKAEILSTLRRLAESGVGVVIVSSELEEVVTTCDRILVMVSGRIVAHLDRSVAPVKVEDILHAAFEVSKE
jgi:ABC-type sugar transport system ATPase subunit